MKTAWTPLPWYAKPAPRILFLRQLRGLSDLRAVSTKDNPRGFNVALTLNPHGVPERHITIQFKGNYPTIYVDGPTDSPHRYPNGSLCMWYPGDPPELRWTTADGAGTLVANIAAHLVKEEWYRLTGEWKGDEVRHGAPDTANDPKPVNFQ